MDRVKYQILKRKADSLTGSMRVTGHSLAVATLLTTLLACGQNPAVTQLASQTKDAIGDAARSTDTDSQRTSDGTEPAQTPDSRTGEPAEARNAETSGGHDEETSNSNAGSSTQTSSNGTSGGDGTAGNAPVITPPTVICRDGTEGAPGAAGRDGERNCTPRTHTWTFPVSELTEQEVASAVLPYRSSRRNKITTLQVGRPSTVDRAGNSYVKDAHQVFAFNIELPPRESVTEVGDLSMTFSLRKFSRDRFDATEVICFLDYRLCSGNRFQAASWQENLNPEFWDNGARDAVNDYFSRQLVAQEIKGGAATGGARVWDNETLRLNVNELVRGSEFTHAMDLLYHGSNPAEPLKRRLLMVIADDTLVRGAHFSVRLTENPCVTEDAIRDSNTRARTEARH